MAAPGSLSPGKSEPELKDWVIFPYPARCGRVIFDEESRNPTSDGSTDAVDRTMAYPDESMHGNAQIDSAVEKFGGLESKRRST
jgi:hypothetical protein